MLVYPNQKIVAVVKEKCNQMNVYACINLGAMEHAMQDLDAGAFKLWCYFAKNQDGYQMALSSVDAANNAGMKKTQYDNAVHTLLEKKYLVKEEKNRYTFYERPAQNNETLVLTPILPAFEETIVEKDEKPAVFKQFGF